MDKIIVWIMSIQSNIYIYIYKTNRCCILKKMLKYMRISNISLIIELMVHNDTDVFL